MKKLAFIALLISGDCFAGAFYDAFKRDSILPRDMQDPIALAVYVKFPCFFDILETNTSEVYFPENSLSDQQSRYFKTEMQAEISTGHLVFKRIPITITSRKDLGTRQIEVLDVQTQFGDKTCLKGILDTTN